MAVKRQAQGAQHVQIKHSTSSPQTPKPQGFEQPFSPLQIPVLSTWNWDGQRGRQRPWRAPSPGRWGCRTSSGARHRRQRAAPGPEQEWQDGWQPGHRGREPSEPQLSQGEGQGTAFPETTTTSGHAFYNRTGILGKYFDIAPPTPKEQLFLSKADEQIKNCSPVPESANSSLISGTATVSTISLGGTARNDSVEGSHEAEIHLPNFRFSHYCKDDLSLYKSTRWCMWNFILGYVDFHTRYMWNFIPAVCGISPTS